MRAASRNLRSPHTRSPPGATTQGSGLLGDSPARNYTRKLTLFNAFAQAELREAITHLQVTPGMRALDAGCGTGEALAWLREAVGPGGEVVGLDLSSAHVATARGCAAGDALVLQGDLQRAPFTRGSFDLIWCTNTVNHLRDRVQGVASLASLLRPGGRIALGQSSLLPDMYFAWDARLERVTNEAVRRYYLDRYGIGERELAPVRAIVGLLRSARLCNVAVRTLIIERVAPLRTADEAYLREAIFRDTWSERLRDYLAADDYTELMRLCDPGDEQFALRRPDFHFLQSFTVTTGEVAR